MTFRSTQIGKAIINLVNNNDVKVIVDEATNREQSIRMIDPSHIDRLTMEATTNLDELDITQPTLYYEYPDIQTRFIHDKQLYGLDGLLSIRAFASSSVYNKGVATNALEVLTVLITADKKLNSLVARLKARDLMERLDNKSAFWQANLVMTFNI